MFDHKIKSTLELSDTSNTKGSDKSMSTYIIALIAVSCIVLLLSFIYLLYRKYKNKTKSKNGETKYNGPIREVWSDPDIDNTHKIITFDKKKGLAARKCNLNELNINIDSSYKSDMVEFSK
jgi:uncharacterized membrane protein YdbT with pleckstrin-like domain